MGFLFRILTAVALAAVVCCPVFAQSNEGGRLSLSERVARLEQQSSQGAGNIDLVNQISALQSQVQVLQGQLEELQHQLNQLQERTITQAKDIDARLNRLEGHGNNAGTTGATNSPSSTVMEDVPLGSPNTAANEGGSEPSTPSSAQELPGRPSPAMTTTKLPDPTATNDPATEKAAYNEAFTALKDGRYAESARRFKAFTEQYPSSELTGNAYYWLGESYYVTQNYRISLDTFQKLLKQFPTSAKAADALLKVGYCQYELKQWDAAEATLNQVVKKYPDTTVARLAQGRLRALKLQEHA